VKRTDEDVAIKVAAVTPAARRRDAEVLVRLLQQVTGEEPVMWLGGIVGFGSCHYSYGTGTEGESPIVSFAPRKTATTIYLLDGVPAHSDALSRLGPHTTGAGCLYLKDVGAIDTDVLREIVAQSYRWVHDGGSAHASMTVTH
jgi:hypothetical protein